MISDSHLQGERERGFAHRGEARKGYERKNQTGYGLVREDALPQNSKAAAPSPDGEDE